MVENCKFCEIIAKKTAAQIVYEDAQFMAFLDIRPLFLGHTLLIPKKHYTTLYDAPDNILQELLLRTKNIGKAIQTAMQSEGSFIAMNNIVSQSVPHIHFHIVPRNKGDGLKGFFWPRQNYSGLAEMVEVRDKIIDKLS